MHHVIVAIISVGTISWQWRLRKAGGFLIFSDGLRQFSQRMIQCLWTVISFFYVSFFNTLYSPLWVILFANFSLPVKLCRKTFLSYQSKFLSILSTIIWFQSFTLFSGSGVIRWPWLKNETILRYFNVCSVLSDFPNYCWARFQRFFGPNPSKAPCNLIQYPHIHPFSSTAQTLIPDGWTQAWVHKWKEPTLAVALSVSTTTIIEENFEGPVVLERACKTKSWPWMDNDIPLQDFSLFERMIGVSNGECSLRIQLRPPIKIATKREEQPAWSILEVFLESQRQTRVSRRWKQHVM